MKRWNFLSGYLQPGDVRLIHKLASELPTNKLVTIIDLGAGSGTSALSASYGRGLWPFQIISVDISDVAIKATCDNMVQYGFDKHWKGHIGRSDRAAKELLIERESVDMIMCDSTHDYASKQDELNSWFPYLVIGASVWIHEYAGYANGIYPGVKIAVDEFIEQGRLQTLEVDGYGWAGKFLK